MKKMMWEIPYMNLLNDFGKEHVRELLHEVLIDLYTQRPKKRQRNNNQCFLENAEDALADNDTDSNIIYTLVLNNIYNKLYQIIL